MTLASAFLAASLSPSACILASSSSCSAAIAEAALPVSVSAIIAVSSAAVSILSNALSTPHALFAIHGHCTAPWLKQGASSTSTSTWLYRVLADCVACCPPLVLFHQRRHLSTGTEVSAIVGFQNSLTLAGCRLLVISRCRDRLWSFLVGGRGVVAPVAVR